MLLRLLVICGLFWFGMQTAYAGVSDWPVVSHVLKIGSCVLADSGAILKSATTHVAGFGVDVLTIVGECATFVIETVTPASDHTPADSDPHM